MSYLCGIVGIIKYYIGHESASLKIIKHMAWICKILIVKIPEEGCIHHWRQYQKTHLRTRSTIMWPIKWYHLQCKSSLAAHHDRSSQSSKFELNDMSRIWDVMFSFMCKLKFERWVSKRECKILEVCGSEWRCGWNWKPICCHLMRQQRYKMIYCIFVGRQYFPFRTITRTKWFCGVAIYCVFATSAYTKLRWTIATRSRQPSKWSQLQPKPLMNIQIKIILNQENKSMASVET